MNLVNDCIYHKSCKSVCVYIYIYILYVNNILLANNDIGLLYDTTKFLVKNFKMKDLDNAFLY